MIPGMTWGCHGFHIEVYPFWGMDEWDILVYQNKENWMEVKLVGGFNPSEKY